MGCNSCGVLDSIKKAIGFNAESGVSKSATGIDLLPCPPFVANPITGKNDLSTIPFFKQVFLHGVRIGYVNTNPGKLISLIHYWDQTQIEVIRLAILAELHEKNYDVTKARKFWAPRQGGLIPGQEDESNNEPALASE